MAKKRKRIEAKRTPTKRQLSRWERQKKTQRIIFIAGSIFLVLILALGGYGIYAHSFKNLRQPVLKVNDTVVKMDYYVDAMKVLSQGVEKDQISTLADYTYNTILRNELIIQFAPELGFDAGSDEVNAGIRQSGLPNNKLNRDLLKADILLGKMMENYIDPQIPDTVEQVNVEALVVGTKEKAEEVTALLNSTNNFISVVDIFSVEPVTKENKGDLGWLPKGMIGSKYDALADSILEDVVFDLKPRVLSEPIYDPSIAKKGGYWIIEVLEKDDDKSAHIRGILLGSEDEASRTRSKLINGEDFVSLVAELSQNQDSKNYDGDLGWVQKGYGNTIINNAAFELEPGDISEPIYDDTVNTDGGYWLIRVLDKDENRQLDEDIISTMRDKIFKEWIGEQYQKSEIVEYLNEDQKAWAIDRVLKNIGA